MGAIRAYNALVVDDFALPAFIEDRRSHREGTVAREPGTRGVDGREDRLVVRRRLPELLPRDRHLGLAALEPLPEGVRAVRAGLIADLHRGHSFAGGWWHWTHRSARGL